jgi:hypothetical protein
VLSLSATLSCRTTVPNPTRNSAAVSKPLTLATPAAQHTQSTPAPVVERLAAGGCAVLDNDDWLCPTAAATPQNSCALERSKPASREKKQALGASCLLDAAQKVSCLDQRLGKQVDMLTGALELEVGAGWFCALRQDGAVLCWGKNPEGGLGDGRSHEAERPVRVKLAKLARQLAVGDRHACALLEDQSVWCWGENSRGALGLGMLPACCDIADPARPAEYLVPQRVRSLPPTASVHALGDASCALTTGGAVYCWGENGSGQLGSPATSEPLASPTRVAGLPVVKQLVMDLPRCALTIGGDSYCWGDGCPLLARSVQPVKIDWAAREALSMPR